MPFEYTLRRRLTWALLALASAPLSAATRLDLELRTPGNEPTHMVISAAATGLTLSLGEPPRREAFFRTEKRRWLLVEHESRTFAELDEPAIDLWTGGADRALERLEEVIAALPEEQREQARALFRGGMPDLMADESTRTVDVAVEARRTSDRATKAGLPCVRWEMLRHGIVVRELWVTPWASIPNGEEAGVAMRDAAAFLDELDRRGRRASTAWSTDDVIGGSALFLDGLRHVDGFPVEVRVLDAGVVVQEVRLLTMQATDPLSVGELAPPAGYQRQSREPV